MKPIGEDRPAPRHGAVERPGHANLEAGDSGGELAPVRGLDDEVKMVREDGEVHHAEAWSLVATLQGPPQGGHAARAAQAPHFATHLQRDADRVAALQPGPRQMRNARRGDLTILTLATCAAALSAPAVLARERQLHSFASQHLE